MNTTHQHPVAPRSSPRSPSPTPGGRGIGGNSPETPAPVGVQPADFAHAMALFRMRCPSSAKIATARRVKLEDFMRRDMASESLWDVDDVSARHELAANQRDHYMLKRNGIVTVARFHTFARWADAQPEPPTISNIRTVFGIHRATAYRWLMALARMRKES